MHTPSPPLAAPVSPLVVHIPKEGPLDSVLEREWLLTDGRGGFAMGTPIGVNRRKYHALLVASARPPVERWALLNSLDEEVTIGFGPGTRTAWLATHRWGNAPDPGFDPSVVRHIARFEKEPHCVRWVYHVHGVEIVKELRLGYQRSLCAVRYAVRALPGTAQRPAVRFRVLPMVTIRDFHTTLPDADETRYQVATSKRTIQVTAQGITLTMKCDHGGVTQEVTVRKGVRYEIETDRNQNDTEDLFNPGCFDVVISDGVGEGNREASFTIVAAMGTEAPDQSVFDDPAKMEHLGRVREGFIFKHPGSAALAPLAIAADDFLVTRLVNKQPLMTIIAGYPWFSDWGRDTMISMVGLMLVCGRYTDAMGSLKTFAAHVDRGMIPNRFDDYSGPPEYNTIDASLWFLHACDRYVRESGDAAGFRAALLPACLQIIQHYQRGTRDGIRMDLADSLITGGDATTQLTWMDAKREGVVFTPRHGKAVEINALWHHGLLSMAGLLDGSDPVKAGDLRAVAAKVGVSFRAKFWDIEGRKLWDCLQPGPDGIERPLPETRPNMLFAVSLEHSPLTPEQKSAVVECARRELLTPLGLRTLSPKDPNYRPHFAGDMMARDAAYHNGTVWPWLIGPYAEAVLRAANFSDAAKAEVRDALRPLLAMLDGDSVGQLFEVYDAEPRANGRRLPGGCMAQAWSVAELLRAAVLAG